MYKERCVDAAKKSQVGGGRGGSQPNDVASHFPYNVVQSLAVMPAVCTHNMHIKVAGQKSQIL